MWLFLLKKLVLMQKMISRTHKALYLLAAHILPAPVSQQD